MSLTPDDDDLEACAPFELIRFWSKVARWSKAFEDKRPGWKVNGGRTRGRTDPDAEKFFTSSV